LVELIQNVAGPGPQAPHGERQLRLTRADGSVVDHFLDRDSCLPTREVSRRAFHPNVDATEVLVETVHGEPFAVDACCASGAASSATWRPASGWAPQQCVR